MSPNDLDFTRRLRLGDGTLARMKIFPAGKPARPGYPCKRRVFVELGEAKDAVEAVFDNRADPADTQDQAAQRSIREIEAIVLRLKGAVIL